MIYSPISMCNGTSENHIGIYSIPVAIVTLCGSIFYGEVILIPRRYLGCWRWVYWFGTAPHSLLTLAPAIGHDWPPHSVALKYWTLYTLADKLGCQQATVLLRYCRNSSIVPEPVNRVPMGHWLSEASSVWIFLRQTGKLNQYLFTDIM